MYLKTMVGKHELWALNPAHVELLECYLAASLRRRTLGYGNMTMMARLPAWMKSARNRPQVISGLRRLRAKAAQLA
ncbi:MAG: hypothetical protein IE921_16585 [Rhodobacteraceae bacterium]|nr:hypothetical protein [Paracoccaceae bacterium]